MTRSLGGMLRQHARSLAILITVAAGVLAGFLLLPIVFPALPNDMLRTRTILAALERPVDAPSAVVLGDSVAMTGLDGHLLGRALGHTTSTWNLGSVGQSLYESLLIIDKLPAATRQVVLGVRSEALRDEVPLHPDKLASYRMYGYKPSPGLFALMRAFALDSLLIELTRPRRESVMRAKWIVRSSLDTWTRQLLRRDLHMERATYDLHYPQWFEQPLDADALDRRIRQLIALHQGTTSSAVSPSASAALEAFASVCQRRGWQCLIVLMPEHPRLRSSVPLEFDRTLHASVDALSRKLGLRMVDFGDLLGEDLFIDQLHPSRAGAQVLTREVAKQLTITAR